MKISRRLVALFLTIVLCLNLIPVTGSISPARADVSWAKDTSNPVFTEDVASGAASVIYDSDASLYKMWYTRTATDFDQLDTLIDDINALGLGTLINDIKNNDWNAIAQTDATELKDVIDYLAGLGTDNLTDILTGTRTILSYATSVDGINWQNQSDVLENTAGEWDKHYVGAPSVIRNSASSYEM
ncbi:hypothetical protein ACFLUO_08175 [Chloroflexota bacterium]